MLSVIILGILMLITLGMLSVAFLSVIIRSTIGMMSAVFYECHYINNRGMLV
jgi:hypothetical protein